MARTIRSLMHVAIASMLLIGALPAQAGEIDELPEHWREWLQDEVYMFIADSERDAFLTLETEAQRREMAERLFRIWGSATGHGSRFERVFAERLSLALNELGTTTSDRARILLLHGPPDVRAKLGCDKYFNPMELWRWAYIPGLGEGVTVLFVQQYGLGKYDLWEGGNISTLQSTGAFGSLSSSQIDYQCINGRELRRAIALAQSWMRDIRVRRSMHHFARRSEKGPESATSRFLAFSTLLPGDAKPLKYSIESSPSGMRGGMVEVGFAVELDREQLGGAKIGSREIIQIDVVGEISNGFDMVDRFRYLFTLPDENEKVALLIERSLRPGEYDLRIKVADENSKRVQIEEIEFIALPVEGSVLPIPTTAAEALALPATAASISSGLEDENERPLLMLLGPEGEGLYGLHRFQAIADKRIRRVDFYLNGQAILIKNRPPFDIDLDLGGRPRLATVLAIGKDAGGREIDRSEISLNIGRERFRVRLEPVSASDRESNRLRATAVVNVPSESKLDRVSLYVGENEVATLYQPPFEAWLPVGAGEHPAYLRAVAWLADGQQSEDIQLMGMIGDFSGSTRVDSVELPVHVTTKKGQPLTGLQISDFTVLEDGIQQELSHVAMHRDLPIRLGIAIDTSGSMEDSLPEVQRVVYSFLENLLRARDRAFVLAFSDRPSLVQSFTADFGSLEHALLALYPERNTALYDAVIYGLYQFSGVQGRKALVVLTDGEDTVSDAAFADMMRIAQSAGVAIYTIGIDLPMSSFKPRSRLRQMAAVTGGRSFFPSTGKNLAGIYEEIDRELRTLYTIAYTSNSPKDADEVRKIKVVVAEKGVIVRSPSGYLPDDV